MPQVSIRIKKNIPVSQAWPVAPVTPPLCSLAAISSSISASASRRSCVSALRSVPMCHSACVVERPLLKDAASAFVRCPELPKMHVVLVRADYGVSTASVYKAILPTDLHPQKARFAELLDAIRAGDTPFVERHLYNALEAPSFRVEPRTEARKKRLLEHGAEHVLMSGSGPTLFGFTPQSTLPGKISRRSEPSSRMSISRPPAAPISFVQASKLKTDRQVFGDNRSAPVRNASETHFRQAAFCLCQRFVISSDSWYNKRWKYYRRAMKSWERPRRRSCFP